jgi:MFS family permease
MKQYQRWQSYTSEQRKQYTLETNSLGWRFCIYGAIKHLQLFEAYLLLILLEWDYNLFQIGILNSITYALTYIFEVPSGVIVDHFGKKNELLCFVFYMISFVFYTFGKNSFTVLVFASVFYGLGEAFRSGTHKAMIMMWLDRQKLSKYKIFIYSRTRSFSNLGSALNAVLSIIIIVFLDNYALVFIISVVPFVADFLMVSTYPSYMNETPNVKKSFFAIMGDTCTALKDVAQTKDKAKPLLSSSSFMAVFTTLKHYIQPIMVLYDALMLSK